MIDFEGFHSRGITAIPRHRLSHDETELEKLTIVEQMDLLKEFLEGQTGKKLVSKNASPIQASCLPRNLPGTL